MNKPPANPANDKILFWGCFLALITTAFGFITRMFLIGTWGTEFGLDPAQQGRLAGIGIWPFAVSIIGFSLIIDKIGYKISMVIAFAGHIIWAIMGVSAYYVSLSGDKQTAYLLLYWGSLILALGNGTVEAFINPVVATLFSNEKTKWLNILHAGWPGGLVVAGIIVIFMGGLPWGYQVGIIAVPAILYFGICMTCQFPVQERVSSGVSYKEMLQEFGVLGAAIVGFLVSLQLMDFFTGVQMFSVYTILDPGTIESLKAGATISFAEFGNLVNKHGADAFAAKAVLATWAKILFVGIGVAIVAGFGVYTQAIGRAFMFIMVLIMIPLATTEIGTDGWITTIMEGVLKGDGEESIWTHAGWVLVYTSAIMMVLRFFAGPIVHAVSPLGLLTISAVLAIVGLFTLSFTTGLMLFAAATLYGVGKTFFWPTMLGVVAEQTPKGGAFTLNAISGIGMLAVGVLGFPYIGTLQADRQIAAVVESEDAKTIDGLIDGDKLTVVKDESIYEIIPYTKIDDDALDGKLTDRMVNGLARENEITDPKKIAELTPLAAEVLKHDPEGEKDADKKAEAEKMQKEARQKLVDKVAEFVGEDADKTAIAKTMDLGEKARGVTAKKIQAARDASNQQALAAMAMFPTIMLLAYIGLIVYFQMKGGYKPVELDEEKGGK